MDMDPEHLESLATEAFERRIANLERENKEYQRRTQGKIGSDDLAGHEVIKLFSCST